MSALEFAKLLSETKINIEPHKLYWSIRALFNLPADFYDNHVLNQHYPGLSIDQLLNFMYIVFIKDIKIFIPGIHEKSWQLLCQRPIRTFLQHDIIAKIQNLNLTPLTDHKCEYPIFGLSGKMHAGKTTMANQLLQYMKGIKYSMAQPLKWGCALLFHFHESDLNDLKNVDLEYLRVSPRFILQRVGTEIFREAFNRYYTKCTSQKLPYTFWIYQARKFINNQKTCIVIDDIRFPDELEMVKSYPLHYTIKIVRPTVDKSLPTNQVGSHASESFDLNTETTFINDNSKAEFIEQINNWIVNH